MKIAKLVLYWMICMIFINCGSSNGIDERINEIPEDTLASIGQEHTEFLGEFDYIHDDDWYLYSCHSDCDVNFPNTSHFRVFTNSKTNQSVILNEDGDELYHSNMRSGQIYFDDILIIPGDSQEYDFACYGKVITKSIGTGCNPGDDTYLYFDCETNSPKIKSCSLYFRQIDE